MTKDPRNKVLLIAVGIDGNIIEQSEVSVDEYYEGSPSLIDSDEYRAAKGIRHLKGEIYGSKGNLMQSFEVRYSDVGEYIGSRAVHEDGTITEE